MSSSGWKSTNKRNLVLSSYMIPVSFSMAIFQHVAYDLSNRLVHLHLIIATYILILILALLSVFFYYKLKNKPDRYFTQIGFNYDPDRAGDMLTDYLKKENLQYNSLPEKMRFFGVDLKRFQILSQNIEIGIEVTRGYYFVFIGGIDNNNKPLYLEHRKNIEKLFGFYNVN
jgi:hypothetical protein